MLNKIFGTKKKDELTKVQEELQIVNGAIAEETQTKNRLAEVTRLIQIELEIGTDNELERRAKRIQTASEQNAQRIAELQTRKAELENQIQELNTLKWKAEIEELAQKDAEAILKHYKARVLLEKLERMKSTIEAIATNANLVSPLRLLRHAGTNSLDKNNPAHRELLEILENLTEPAKKQAQKEVDELFEEMKKFMD
jgi:hypothetical protein